MKLYTYQKELVNSKEKRILVNWARGAGKDTGLAYYILENKPSRVLVMGEFGASGLIDALKQAAFEYNVEINNDGNGEYTITFKGIDRKVIIGTKNNQGSDFDLIIRHVSRWVDAFKEFNNTYIAVMTENETTPYHKRLIEEGAFDKKITVDYKRALQEGAVDSEKLIEIALTMTKHFYNWYAISDKPHFDDMSFRDFKDKALQKLQKQFLDIPDTKDTVLTRKNIIEMIKDLQQLN